MEALREFLKGWVGKGLLILFLLPLAITGFESIVHSGDNPNAIAKVGEQSIDGTTLQNSINTRRQELLEQVKGDSSVINDAALRDQVLQSLIDRALIAHQANQLGYTISDATITQLIATDPHFADASDKFSNDVFASFLKDRGMTKDQLFDLIRQDNVVSEFGRGILGTVFYPKNKLDSFLNQLVQIRPVSVARLNWQNFASQVQVSDSEITNYYNQHKADLKSSDMVDLTYLVLDKNTLKVAEPTEQEINQQYQALANNAQTEYEVATILINNPNAQATLTGLKQQLDSNQADFAALAKQYSQDEGSKNAGGNIGSISQAMFPKDYDKVMTAIRGLKEGQVTAPIQTEYGYQLFKLVKVNGSSLPSLDSMRATLHQQALEQKRETMYQELVGKINNDAVASANLAEIANRYHLTTQTLKNYPKTDNQTLLNQAAIVTAAFDPTTLQDGSVSVGVDIKDKTVWVQPKNYRPSKNLSQAEAMPMAKAALTQQKAQALALAQAKQIATQIQQNNSTVGVPVTFTSLGSISRQDPRLLAEERNAAFSVPATADKLAVTTQATEQGASILVGGVIQQDSAQLTPEVRRNMANMLRDNLGQAEWDDYLAYLRTVTPVTIKDPNSDTDTAHSP